MSIWAVIKDKGQVCEAPKMNKMMGLAPITVAMQTMVFLHALHAVRLIYKILDKLRRRRKKSKGQGLIKCLIMDCYCCIGSSVYIYTQSVFWRFRGDCKDILPYTEWWIKVEIIY